MPYNYNIPLAGDRLSVSQGNINTNFIALGAIAGNGNASSASLNPNSGFDWLFLPSNGNLGNNPPPAANFPAFGIGMYTANLGSSNEIYINKITGLPGFPVIRQIPMTLSSLSNGAIPLALSGFSYLPSGLIIKWGNVAAPNTLPVINTVDLNAVGPAYTQVFNIQLTSRAPNPAPHFIYEYSATIMGPVAANTFNFGCYWGTVANPVYWYSIGY